MTTDLQSFKDDEDLFAFLESAGLEPSSVTRAEGKRLSPAPVHSIAELYGGKLQLDPQVLPFNGARCCLTIPNAS